MCSSSLSSHTYSRQPLNCSKMNLIQEQGQWDIRNDSTCEQCSAWERLSGRSCKWRTEHIRARSAVGKRAHLSLWRCTGVTLRSARSHVQHHATKLFAYHKAALWESFESSLLDLLPVRLCGQHIDHCSVDLHSTGVSTGDKWLLLRGKEAEKINQIQIKIMLLHEMMREKEQHSFTVTKLCILYELHYI